LDFGISSPKNVFYTIILFFTPNFEEGVKRQKFGVKNDVKQVDPNYSIG